MHHLADAHRRDAAQHHPGTVKLALQGQRLSTWLNADLRISALGDATVTVRLTVMRSDRSRTPWAVAIESPALKGALIAAPAVAGTDCNRVGIGAD
jgi:hypothetical protein